MAVVNVPPRPRKGLGLVGEHQADGRQIRNPGAARALVVRDVIRLQPSGAYAANVMGLSDQVPSRIVFLTDGPARKVKIGKREIVLQHTTPRNMATAGRKSGTIIHALRDLGKTQINDGVLAAVRRFITNSDRAAIRKDLRHAPAWIADLLRPLTEPVA